MKRVCVWRNKMQFISQISKLIIYFYCWLNLAVNETALCPFPLLVLHREPRYLLYRLDEEIFLLKHSCTSSPPGGCVSHRGPQEWAVSLPICRQPWHHPEAPSPNTPPLCLRHSSSFFPNTRRTMDRRFANNMKVHAKHTLDCASGDKQKISFYIS